LQRAKVSFGNNLDLPQSDPLLAYMRSDDGSLKEDSPLRRFGNLMIEAMIASGRVPQSEELLRRRLEKAGFVDVQSFTLKQPFGPWAKDEYEYIPDHTYLNVKSPHTHGRV
jgi:hypothetical protein